MTPVELFALALGGGAMAADLRSRVLPNWLTGAGLLAGLSVAGWSGGGRGLLLALGGAALGLSLFAMAYLLGGLGGGDVKLMAAFGALLGPRDIVIAGILAAVTGAILAGISLLVRPHVRAIPYAPAIVTGVWLVLLGRR